MPSLTVIIPALDEADRIGPVLRRVVEGEADEVLVVDGGSNDATAAIAAAHGARVIEAAPGRGRQLNAGAAAARGGLLLFLHADTLLPRGYGRVVRDTLARPGVVAGAFTLRIDAPERALRLVERAVGLRCRWLQMPYGDQAIFTTRRAFDRAGGVPELPAMEDYELIRRLRQSGRIHVADEAVLTSARRWIAGGVWRTTLLNQACIWAYRAGLSAERIAEWRKRGGESDEATKRRSDGGSEGPSGLVCPLRDARDG